jgi:hypothetical protein
MRSSQHIATLYIVSYTGHSYEPTEQGIDTANSSSPKSNDG